MAWFRPMGADEVAYHQATVLGREDDHPGRALDYYGSRGETPLRWGGAGAARLGLSGEVTPDAYEAAFGPGGFQHPVSGERLVASRRPGFELVVGAHKSVAVLGVMGEADAMHSILDVETEATMAALDDWFQDCGGRRGRAQMRTATGGLTYATTRHATSRAGDPAPHDHVLIANVIEMLDRAGGHKALDSAALRDTVEAATMVGRLHSAAHAVALGFEIAPDAGPSGNLRHWRIAGIPDEVCEVFSKRSDEIAEHLAEKGQHGYRARSVAARQTRKAKRHTSLAELTSGWHAELEAAGWPIERLAVDLADSQRRARGLPFALTGGEVARLAAEVLDVDGSLLRKHKVFTRTHLIAEVAPRLYGSDPAELDRVLGHITASREVVPLIRVAGAREQCFTTVEVLHAEHTITRALEQLADRPGPTVAPHLVEQAVTAKERAIGHPLTPGQRDAVEALCASTQGVTVLVGVAGSGKTTALDAAATALEASGYRVLGTSTSGQAARTLGAEADISARTLASTLWRLEQGKLTLDERTVVIVDEAGMANDADLARLTLAVERSGASLALVGDHRQLDAVGPGGALSALLDRRPELAVSLNDNVRQHDPAERAALAELRDGSIPAAVAWYSHADRIRTAPTRMDTLVAMTNAWAGDVANHERSALLAWRRADVADLNRLAREHWGRLGHLRGPDVKVAGGRTYAAGDLVVALAPDHASGVVTSEQLTVAAVASDRIEAETTTGRTVTLTGAALDAEHLDHAYAVTAHRSQGATYDRAHVLAAGGGRELAYVALSRARDHTTIHATADNLGQAVDDLQADWGVEAHQRWISQSPAEVGRHPEPARALGSPPTRGDLSAQVEALEDDYRDLRSGAGRWADTPEGRAARHLVAARDQLDDLDRESSDPSATRRSRKAAMRALPGARLDLAHAEQQWAITGQPVADQLADAIGSARQDLQRHETAELVRRLDALQVSRGRDLGPELGLSL